MAVRITPSLIGALYPARSATGWDINDQAFLYTLTNGNRDASESDTDRHQVRAVNTFGSRKVYFELVVAVWCTNPGDIITGIAEKDAAYGVSWNTSDVKKIIHLHSQAQIYQDSASYPTGDSPIDKFNAVDEVEFWAVDAPNNKVWHGHSDSTTVGWTGTGSPMGDSDPLVTSNTGFTNYAPYFATDTSTSLENKIRLNEQLRHLLYGLPVGFTTVYGETDGTNWASPSINSSTNSNWTISGLNVSKTTAVYCQSVSTDKLPNFVYFEVELTDIPATLGEFAVGVHIGTEPFGADFSLSDAIYIQDKPATGDNAIVYDGRDGSSVWEDSILLGGGHFADADRIRVRMGGGAIWIGAVRGATEQWYNSGAPMATGITGSNYVFLASGNEASTVSLTLYTEAADFIGTIPNGFSDLIGGT